MRRLMWLMALAGACGAAGCRRASPTHATGGPSAGAKPPGTAEAPAELVFPADLRVADDSVNRFIEQALAVSTGRDYDAFRLLWVTVDEPFAREQFERGWQSLKALRVEVLQKIRDPVDQSIFYGLYAVAELDPDMLPEGQEPQRRVVLEIRKEQDQWRLAHARDEVRQAIIGQYEALHAKAGPATSRDGGS